jgi:hypothetical protein
VGGITPESMGGITPEQVGEIIPESVGGLSPEWWAQSLRNHQAFQAPSGKCAISKEASTIGDQAAG